MHCESIISEKLIVKHIKNNKNEKYKVRFTPMNIDGKLSNTTDWQIFENPYLNDKKEY